MTGRKRGSFSRQSSFSTYRIFEKSNKFITIDDISDLEHQINNTPSILQCRLNYIVIAFYLPSCLGQETVKGLSGLRVKLPPAHLSTTQGGGFTLSL